MAKYNITHVCGHVSVENIGGPEKDRLPQVKRIQNRPCAECARAETTKRAAEASHEAGLPALSGSEKQISWAEAIRVKMLSDADAFIAKLPQDDPRTKKVHAAIRAQAEAKFWIDNRDADIRAVIKSFI